MPSQWKANNRLEKITSCNNQPVSKTILQRVSNNLNIGYGTAVIAVNGEAPVQTTRACANVLQTSNDNTGRDAVRVNLSFEDNALAYPKRLALPIESGVNITQTGLNLNSMG